MTSRSRAPVLTKQSSFDRKSPFGQLLDCVHQRCDEAGLKWTPNMQQDLPKKWEKHGDMVILPTNCFREPSWRNLGRSLWKTVADALQVSRVGRKHKVEDDDYRTPYIDLLYGQDGWVEHVDNHVRYQYDVTKCMFSIGNINEKLRVAGFDCRQEVVVDCFAGIGYFTLPYLVHAQAQHVYAIDWNPDAIEALSRNIDVNKVTDRCTVLEGDCRKVVPHGVADRVNMGLLPSARQHLVYACRALKKSGGRIILHENVTKSKMSTPLKLERADSGVSTAEEGSTTSRISNSPTRPESVNPDSASTTPSDETSSNIEEGEEAPPRKPGARRQALLDEIDAMRVPNPMLADTILEKWPLLDQSYRVMAHDTASMCIRFMNNIHDVQGITFTCQIERVGKIKSYAPHVDHCVVDLLLRPVPNQLIDFDAHIDV